MDDDKFEIGDLVEYINDEYQFRDLKGSVGVIINPGRWDDLVKIEWTEGPMMQNKNSTYRHARTRKTSIKRIYRNLPYDPEQQPFDESDI
jgi:hypothetical protein